VPEHSEDRSELLKQLHIDRGTAGSPHPWVRRLTLAGSLLLVLGGLLWLGLSRTAPLTVRTATARPAGDGPGPASVLDASGYVTARRQATVSAKITGKVTEVLIEEGMRVQEGAVLARLDDTEARAQLGLARAQLTAARSQQAEIRAQLEQAERDFARQQELYQKGLVPAQALDAALGSATCSAPGWPAPPSRSRSRRSPSGWPRCSSTTRWCARRSRGWWSPRRPSPAR
jgi:HlyD family secretion protein